MSTAPTGSEPNAMNINPNHGSSRKEKQMNVITKATSLAVLVTLGLTLGAQTTGRTHRS